MLMLRKIVFFLFLFVGLSLFAQQDYMVSSYVRGNFYNRGRISTESLRASDDLIFLNVHPNKDGSLSFENPRVFQGKGVTTWEGLIKSVRAKVKGTKVKIRLGASSGEWKAMIADEAARTTFAKNIKTVLEKNKLDGIDLDFEWAENEKEYKDYSLAILKMREVLGNKYLFSVSLHPVCYKISKEAIEAVDFISLQCYGPSPVRFPIEKYCSDIQMVLEYGIPKEKLVAGVPFYGVTKDNSKKTEAYFNFVQNGLVTSPAQNEVIYQGDPLGISTSVSMISTSCSSRTFIACFMLYAVYTWSTSNAFQSVLHFTPSAQSTSSSTINTPIICHLPPAFLMRKGQLRSL